ncbi:phage integrase N-terminal SAM-like domain-containing protein [Phormidium sp. FACHB-592]|uniref:phage integrase N-terminal SAM-like domain-containing protein n=1 Tax=Stenomitos frigidus TaxID=1886765 RepID=UPI0016829F00|nr:phage integrase N-terminal SAM-like domain-containing protein [Phormidium sp. FACHB-592]
MSQSQPPRWVAPVRQSVQLKHCSPKTEQAYRHYIRAFLLCHHKRQPRDIGRR